MAEEVKKAPAKKAAPKKTAPKAEAPVEEVKAEVVTEEAPKAEKAKKAPAKKAEKKVEAPKKPMPTEARAIAKNVRVTPRKVRLVIDLVRGKDVKVALGILVNTNKAASEPVAKLIIHHKTQSMNRFLPWQLPQDRQQVLLDNN